MTPSGRRACSSRRSLVFPAFRGPRIKAQSRRCRNGRRSRAISSFRSKNGMSSIAWDHMSIAGLYTNLSYTSLFLLDDALQTRRVDVTNKEDDATLVGLVDINCCCTFTWTQRECEAQRTIVAMSWHCDACIDEAMRMGFAVQDRRRRASTG